MSAKILRPDLDVCACGDFRRDHDTAGCMVCRTMHNVTRNLAVKCTTFRLHERASAEEIERQDNLETYIRSMRSVPQDTVL